MPAFRQPEVRRNAGGDCFACALTAGLRALFPEREVEFDKVWEFWQYEGNDQDGAKRVFLSNTWNGARNAFVRARYEGDFPLEYRADIVAPDYSDPERWPHTFYSSSPGYEWAVRLEAWLSAGWLALSVISYEGNANRGEWQNGFRITDDHFVLYDGVRSFWRKHERVEGASGLVYQIHVVCSAKGEYWIDLDDLLEIHGAGGWWLFRREQHGREE